jgi:hypothetical protein
MFSLSLSMFPSMFSFSLCLCPLLSLTLSTLSVTASASEQRRRRLALYDEVCDTLTNPGVLTQYLTEKLPDVQARWTVRTEMTKQWAITSMLSYSFFIEQRDPSKYVFAIDRGDVLSLNFRPAYHRETGKQVGFFCGGVLVVYWWCIGGVLVVYWWCTGGVLVVYWWCTGL